MKKNYLMKLMLSCIFLMSAIIASAQTGSVSGRVMDETNQPLPGATVSLKGTDRSTSTDVSGNFNFNNVPTGSATLVVKFIGYLPFEKLVTISNTNQVVNFTLSPSSENLNEVVIVGYGTQRKADVTGSIATLTTKDFVKGQITTPEQLIMGKVAGVQITSNGGAPGAGSTIRIRGGASLNASNDPLIVIDGVPIDNNGISGSPNALSLINPNDIESMNILKDASAAAIYGSRASNGVIIITTKKGQTGKPQLSFNTNLSVANTGNKVDILSAEEFTTLINNTNSPLATPALKTLAGTSSTDWQNEIYQSAVSTDNNLSLIGSVKNLPYRVSLGYLNQDGVLRTGNLERTSLSLNVNPRFFNDLLKVNVNLKGSLSNSRFADQGAIGAAASFDPTQPVESGNANYGGYYEWLDAASTNGLRSLSPKNPLGLLEQRDDNSNVKRSIGNIQFDYTLPFLRDLRANLNLGYDVSKGSGTIFVPEAAASNNMRFKDADGTFRSGTNNEYLQEKTNKLVDFYLNYTKDLTSAKSRIDLMAGTSFQDFYATEYAFADFSTDGVKRPGSDPNFAFDKPQNRLLSYYGRMVYSLNSKYILTTTVRADGSSRLSPENRWGVFPSAALAWNISEEAFIKDSKTISNLKLRVGYGITGQQDGINNYSYLGNYGLSGATAQYQLGGTFFNMYRPSAYNPNLKWEETATANAGIDFGFAKNRVTGSLDYYFKKTKDLLNVITQPAGTNFINEFIANVGNMENKGLEFLINTEVIQKKDVSWNVGFNATYNKNTITNLTSVADPNYIGVTHGGISGGTGNNIQIHSTGFNRSAFYVYQQVYNAEGKPIEDTYVDRNLDGQITDKDLYRFKGPDAQVYLGFNSNVSYKKWNAGFVMRASLGNYVYNNVASSTGTFRNIFNPLNFLNNGSSDILETNFSGSGTRYFKSDYYIQNASFLKMDNLNVGYTVGKVFNNSANLRLNANAQNVFTITKYKGIDPEINGGIDNNFYPRPRTFVLGLNLDF
ncbi:SusC/RagA family TonB-linked outer membrane protein [Daejeonella oryzae]|uniref:SusC/RagA family TonB-linked outer membrane protein n=1 Tax=Daejeonella oryzae TaxID=1122943 RepID=UPI00047D659F|nr:TonB-dependent receptor [Daejeonella oryzae]